MTLSWNWSAADKAVARRAFNLALNRELEVVVHEAKKRAAKVVKATELWELEDWLGKRRREIDETFDYRYSVLPLVFAGLLRDGMLTEKDLEGMDPDKIARIKSTADFFRER